MAFNPADLYLASGLVGVYNSWTPTVTKFDASTFYNWEQDNEPIYDLEERTALLWEKLGNPIANDFSGIPGKMFVVSANAPFAGDSSGIIFKNLSSVINILPSPIPYPVVIEVASFGDLGYLDLKGVKVDKEKKGAGLEIVNRNFARTVAGDATFSGTPVIYINSQNLYETLLTTSSIAIKALVASSTGENRWNSNNRGWISPSLFNETTTASASINFNAANLINHNNNTNVIYYAPYSTTQDQTMGSDHVTTTNIGGSLATYYNFFGTPTNSMACFASIYGNYLRGVNVQNCTGPIYIRNFCIDGAGSTSGASLDHSQEYGVNIINSNIILENTLSIRNKKAGFKFEDSSVTIRRGLFSSRNFPLSSPSTRSREYPGVGIDSYNSLIKVESQTSPITVSGINLPIQISNNDIGIRLHNSQIVGGDKLKTTGAFASSMSFLHVFANASCGIQTYNSHVNYQGVVNVSQNRKGFSLNNSVLTANTLTIQYNQDVGIEALNSTIQQNPDLIKINESAYYAEDWEHEQFSFAKNGQHLVLDNSNLLYTKDINMPAKIGKSLYFDSIGTDEPIPNRPTSKPSIVIKNNSYAEFVHTKIMQGTLGGASLSIGIYHSDAVFGYCVQVLNNSKAKFIGSKTAETMLLGTPDSSMATIPNVVLAYANDNSELEFNGNTLIAQGSVDVLAENNSVIKFNPQQTSEKTLDTSGWDLADKDNHTRVELHSTRACLVADSNSMIKMENLGHVYKHWTLSQLEKVDYIENTEYFELTAPYTSGGYMQFYPNGNSGELFTASSNLHNLNSATATNKLFNSQPNTRIYGSSRMLTDLTPYSSTSAGILRYSTGGMCVRALNDSQVDVFNVNFPAGWVPASGIYYDVYPQSLNSTKLRIWNICDSSRLHASLCSVSSTYPSGTSPAYKGPSAVWVAGGNLGTGAKQSAAPTATPDTGAESIIDYFGASTTTTGSNYGIFRIYMSPTSRAKLLSFTTNASTVGIPYQLVAQGYNLSGGAIMNNIGGDLSSIYVDGGTSSFFASSFIDPSFARQIVLDESAANTFSNAKHNAVAKSGRTPLVTIIKVADKTSPGSQAFDASGGGYGKGLKSLEIFDLRRDN